MTAGEHRTAPGWVQGLPTTSLAVPPLPESPGSSLTFTEFGLHVRRQVPRANGFHDCTAETHKKFARDPHYLVHVSGHGYVRVPPDCTVAGVAAAVAALNKELSGADAGTHDKGGSD